MSRNTNNVLMILTVVMLLSLTGCGGGGGDSSVGGGGVNNPPSNVRKWTYMVYMGGDNNLSTAGLLDLNEMEKAGSDGNVNIVLQAEFSKKYTNFSELGLSYSDQTMRFLIKNDNNPDKVNLTDGQAVGNLNMAAATTLKDFIVWAKNNYPAENYALVIWDHGAGWKKARLKTAFKGAVQDETSKAFMSLPDLAKAVRDSGVRFDVINFDACLMGMYEVAYEFRGLTDYMVFSEEVVPGDGDPYDTILGALKQSPAMTGLDLGKTMVNKFLDFYDTNGRPETAVTRSLVDMARVDALHSKVVQLAEAIVSEYGTVSSVVAAAQNNTQSYEYSENHDLYDFATYLEGHLAAGSTRTAAIAVKTAVGNAVVLNRLKGDKVNKSHGLAIYAPTRNQVSSDGEHDDIQKYSTLAVNSNRANTWLNAVDLMSGNLSDTILKPGGFAFYLKWDTDADLDLYVWEGGKQETLQAPWMGPTSPNGYFSGDSTTTGVSEEYYVANDYVEEGQYDVIINYFANGSSKKANASLYYIDPKYGVNDFTLLKTVPMDLTAPYTGDFSDLTDINDLNAYSDWWYPSYIVRALPDRYQSVRINSGQRSIKFQIKRKKGVPGFTHITR